MAYHLPQPPAQQQPPTTPSSEIIHLVSTFADTLDSLPPTLTRSLSDLKELDAVLSGSLHAITTKLQLLLSMMHSPTVDTPGATPTYTPFERLKLLREVTEDARVFRLGGEDKIRVATGTCETIATHTSHLSTLSTLLLTYLPSHLLPMLPPPSAPHGYPASVTPTSALARRQIFDYPPATNHIGEGSTMRMQGALGMVREHWDLTRGRGGRGGPGGPGSNIPAGKKRYDLGAMGQSQSYHKEGQNPTGGGARHANQYTKKKPPLSSTSSFNGHPSGFPSHRPSNGSHSSMLQPQHPPYSSSGSLHGGGMSSFDANNKEKRRTVAGNGASSASLNHSATHSSSFSAHPPPESAPLVSSLSRTGNGMYPGMASAAEYEAATSGAANGSGARGGKRKGEGDGNTGKRRKKGIESPDITPRATPAPTAAAVSKSTSRRAPAAKPEVIPANLPPLPHPDDAFIEGVELAEGEEGMDEDGDGQVYCYCHRVSFGEMIGCDGTECEREWFHLACVGLSSIPKGRWFCQTCRTSRGSRRK